MSASWDSSKRPPMCIVLTRFVSHDARADHVTFPNNYRPEHERITKDEVEAVIESFKKMNWWP